MKKFVLMMLLLSSFPALAASAKKEESPPPLPKEIWLNPLRIQVESKSSRPKSIPVVFRIVLNNGYFDEVCAEVPYLVDTLNVRLKENLWASDIMEGRTKGDFSLEMTRFLKSKLANKKAVYSVEIHNGLPGFDEKQREFHNKCNLLPVNIVK